MADATQATSKLTYEDYAAYPEDGQRHEIIDGEHFVNPAPTTNHQRFSRRIHFQLFDQIDELERGEVFNAPYDVQFSDHDIVQPDLIIVMNERRQIITPTRIIGVPHLIVEILSPSNSRHDRVTKMELYERVGLPEYWIVEPDKQSVDQFVLGGSKYSLVGSHTTEIKAATIANASVDLTRVW